MSTERQSYVPGFEADIFISYGHLDNKDTVLPWITALEERLEIRVRERLGSQVSIWRDPEIDGLTRIRPILEKTASNSALLLSVITPAYVQSKWCKKEVDWFIAGTERDGVLQGGAKSRILRVLKTPLEDLVAFPALKSDETPGFEFYDEDRNRSPRLLEYPATPGLPGYKEYWTKSLDLADAIVGILRDMKKAVAKREAAEKRHKTVFVATTSGDTRGDYERICQELHDKGHVVRTPASFDASASEIQERVKVLLADCDASVHLLGRKYGLIPEGGDLSMPELQYQLARTSGSGKPFRQLIWSPRDMTEIEVEARQKDFLNRIDTQTAAAVKAEIVKSSFDEFKRVVLDALARPLNVPISAAAGRSIYLVCDEADLKDEGLTKMYTFLLREGYRVDLPPFKGEPSAVREWEEETICERNATVIFYGAADDLWVKQKRRTIQKALANRGERAANKRALYLYVPKDQYKTVSYLSVAEQELMEVDGFPLLILGDCGPFEGPKLQRLLDRLRTGAAHV
jgi:hypothetical protein